MKCKHCDGTGLKKAKNPYARFAFCACVAGHRAHAQLVEKRNEELLHIAKIANPNGNFNLLKL